ncbi:TPA: magnesium/cobalt transporter CorA [Candidatus Woesearchaeota archaeon]|nr:magnesium/cobalt transporter CorA [Candidatus Woesearchaeota archaeon]
MIDILTRSNEKIVKGELEDLHTKKIVWVDTLDPTDVQLKKISEHSGISVNDFKEHHTARERPNTFEFEKYSMIVFGCPASGYHLPTTIAVYILGNNNIITIRKKEIAGIQRMKDEILEKSPKYFDSAAKVIRVMFERIVDDYFAELDKLQAETDRIEARAFKQPDEKIMEEIFKIKKQTLHMHKTLIANREVITQIEKQYLSKLSRKEIYEFTDIKNDTIQLIDSTETLRELATGVIDIYMTSVSNQMNIVVKKLTVAASYVLIPTLIASIYGMNFHYMPEIPWKWGYPFSLGIMVLSIMAMYVYFKKSHWL